MLKVMNETPSFTVDLDDPGDIKVKRETAEREVEAHERELLRWQVRVAKLRRVEPDTEEIEPDAEILTQIVDTDTHTYTTDADETPAKAVAPGMQELVVGVIQRDGEMQAKDVTGTLREEGYEVDTVSVSNALWYAAEKSKRIRRVGHGRYAPLATPDTTGLGNVSGGIAEAALVTTAGIAAGAGLASIMNGIAKG
jgi:hypothetical protein